MTFRVLPYKKGSKSAKALALELGGKVLKLKKGSYKYKDGDTTINWGNSDPGEDLLARITDNRYYPINGFGEYIRQASNKLLFFQALEGEDCLPPFWTNKDDIKDEDFPVVCRTILNGHSGAGIVLANCRDDVVDAPLYVKYVKKMEEYRVHVGRDYACLHHQDDTVSVIAAQRKARKLEVPDEKVNWQIRNHKNGFVYVRYGFDLPDNVREAAIKAFRKTGLDFGAVDVITTKAGAPYVLEINTAPGLEGQTVKDYANFFRGMAE